MCFPIFGSIDWESNLTSALIQGSATGLAIAATIMWEFYKRQCDDRAKTRAILQAIETELLGIMVHYSSTRKIVESHDLSTPFDLHYRIEEDYFAIYHSNTAMIGSIPESVRTDIVNAYICLKSLVDTFRVSNDLQDAYNDYVLEDGKFVLLNNNMDFTDHYQGVVNNYRDNLINVSKGIKESNDRAVSATDKALNSLKQFLGKY